MGKPLLLAAFMLAGVAGSYAQEITVNYTIDQGIIAGIGGKATGGSYSLEGTGGEAIAGVWSTGPPYGLNSGFWYSALSPTAAGAEINGKVLGLRGEPLRNVTVMLSGGTFTTPMVTRTNGFGMFSFSGIETGGVYVVGVVSRRYGFEQQNQVLTLTDGLATLVFRADWQN